MDLSTYAKYISALQPHSYPTLQHPALEMVHVNDMEARPCQYDAAVSYSSLEHDGLGRYSDPLSPNGDIDQVTLPVPAATLEHAPTP